MRTPRSSAASRRKSKSVMAFPYLFCFVMVSMQIVVVESLVSSPIPKPSSRSQSGSGVFDNDNDNDSDDILRKLLQDQGKKNRFQYQYEGRSLATANGATTTTAASTSATTSTTTTTLEQQRTSPHLDVWRDYEALRQTNLEDEALAPFFFESGLERQKAIANRFVQVATTFIKARDDWTESQHQKKMALEAAAAVAGVETIIADEEEADVSLKPPDTDDPAALRLCNAVASLGPLAVKLGQTLSQRPDIVGKDACDALKRLQTQNTPFENDLAHAVLRESLDYWDGPLAANLVVSNEIEIDNATDGANANKKPLFRNLSKEPIASASLGQVYKATTWEGVDIALKVQRPDALSIIAIDVQCFRIASNVRNTVIDWSEKWNALTAAATAASTKQQQQQKNDEQVEHTPETGMTEDEVRSRGDEGTVASVIDRVARDIKRELDYTVEAENSYRFRDSLSFLGFVDTPDVLLATNKILATRFVNGHHLSNLNNPKHELALARMAVEACTASMVLTGFVHADPHEGNLMFREDDGKIVFLDFGLMSDVDQDIMEAFARGIQALLSEDFVSLADSWSDSGFVTNPIMHRKTTKDLWRVDPNYGQKEFAIDLEHYMKTTNGGLSRFGALATVLNKKISPNWLVFTPPYVLLLIRTFLTLEGIAAQVDPDFNIYEMSLPWVVRRSLSPSTDKGREVLRNTILKKDNRIQWERVMELMEMQKAAAEASSKTELTEESSPMAITNEPNAIATTEVVTPSPSKEDITSVAASRTPEEKERKSKEFADARKGAMKDAMGTLLGSTNGRALRSVLKDLDTPDLVWKLGSKEGRPIVRMGIETALKTMSGSGSANAETKSATTTESSSNNTPKEIENYRPVSEECKQLREKQTRRTKQVTRFLIRRHFSKCLRATKGIAGMARLMASALQITISLLLRKTIRNVLAQLPIRPKTKRDIQTPAAAGY